MLKRMTFFEGLPPCPADHCGFLFEKDEESSMFKGSHLIRDEDDREHNDNKDDDGDDNYHRSILCITNAAS